MNSIKTTLILLGFFIVSKADHWRYPDLEKDEEFPKWGGICDAGHLQSPINLDSVKAFKGILPDYEFHNYNTVLHNVKITNNGHTVKLKFDAPKLWINGGPLKGGYVLEEAHFHWYSEHTIDERRYPFEMHLVHRSERYNNITEAIKHKDGLAVLGVLFHISAKENEVIDAILQNIDIISPRKSIGIQQKIANEIILMHLLPDDPSENYFTYKGSLTTPSCDESVTWTVYLETEAITLHQIEQFMKIEAIDGSRIKNNFRPVQKVYNRPVTLVSDWNPRGWGLVPCGSAPGYSISLTSSMVYVMAAVIASYFCRSF